MPSAKDSMPAGQHHSLQRLLTHCRSFSPAHCPLQFDNQWYLALVNKLADEVAKAGGSVHTFAQVQLLRSVVRARLALRPNHVAVCIIFSLGGMLSHALALQLEDIAIDPMPRTAKAAPGRHRRSTWTSRKRRRRRACLRPR